MRQRDGGGAQGLPRPPPGAERAADQAGAQRASLPVRLAQPHRARGAARRESDALVTTRRAFLKTSALTIGFALAPRLVPAQEARLPGSLQTNRRLDAWLSIDANGGVTIFTGKVELGQGIGTALSQIAADELDVDLT